MKTIQERLAANPALAEDIAAVNAPQFENMVSLPTQLANGGTASGLARDWRYFVPDTLVAQWPDLSLEAKLAAHAVAVYMVSVVSVLLGLLRASAITSKAKEQKQEDLAT